MVDLGQTLIPSLIGLTWAAQFCAFKIVGTGSRSYIGWAGMQQGVRELKSPTSWQLWPTLFLTCTGNSRELLPCLFQHKLRLHPKLNWIYSSKGLRL